jgi:2-deoxy-D-gluconate 3-dehydrogenase
MVMDMIPLRQLASPQDVADAVVFLASDKAGMITGDSLKIDGGWTAR